MLPLRDMALDMDREEYIPTPAEELSARLEGLLFAISGAHKKSTLLGNLKCTQEELKEAVNVLKERLRGGGTALIETESELRLATSANSSDTVEEVSGRALQGEVGQAGLEVVAIVLYRGPTTRFNIDYIRGVNSSATVRTLVSRGLLERVRAENDAREFLYRPTTELMAHLSTEDARKLPDYEKIKSEISKFEKRGEEEAYSSGAGRETSPQEFAGKFSGSEFSD